MPSPIRNNWTLRRLINNTYAHQEFRNRFDYQQRDMVKAITIEKVDVYDGKAPGKARTKFIIRTQSTPQYHPYYTKKDSRGRPRKRQMKYRHQYQVTIQLDHLSLDVPFKGRTGALGRWDFGPSGKATKVKQGRNVKIIEGSNVTRGLNGDFWFRSMNLWAREGILFGRDWTNGRLPVRVNPKFVVFADKHFLACIEHLMNTGYLK
jgi:hypothetical protein